MKEIIVEFISANPVAVVAFVLILCVASFYRGYTWGEHDAKIDQRREDEVSLCSYDGPVEFEIGNKVGDRWLVTSILQPRSKKYSPGYGVPECDKPAGHG